MDEVKTRPFRFNLYDVVVPATMANVPIARRVFDALKASGKVKDRLIYLNKNESNDVDFVSKFSLKDDCLFGTFVRLNQTHDSILKISDLDADEIEVSKIIAKSKDDSAGTVKSISYFCLHGHTLVMNNARDNLSALKCYLMEFLRKNGQKDHELEFVKKFRLVENLGTNEISSIQIGESAFMNPKFNGSGLKTTFKDLTKPFLKAFLGELIPESEFERIISAYLVIKLNQREIKKDDALKVALKLVDDENVIVTGTNRRKVKGTEIVVTEERRIELTTEGVVNEFMLEQEMISIAKHYNVSNET